MSVFYGINHKASAIGPPLPIKQLNVYEIFSLVGLSFLALAGQGQSQEAAAANKTFHNPILPGWNSDPSCTFVK